MDISLGAAFAGITLIFNGRSMMKKEQREVLKIIRDYQTEITKLDQNSRKPEEQYKHVLWGYAPSQSTSILCTKKIHSRRSRRIF